MLTGILSVISAVFGVPILTNGIALVANNAHNIGTYLTILLGIVLIVIALFMRIIKKLFIYPLFKLLSTVVGFTLVLALISSAFLFIYGRADTATYNEDYLIVLGCGLDGSEPSDTLASRLDKATEYAKRNTDCKIIVTGGMGKGEDITEAEAMYRYLVDNGITPDRIIKENNATSTAENFEFSNRLTHNDLQNKSAVFITNDFHIYRANSLAKLEGLYMNHLHAPTPWHSVLPSYLRENLALIKMFVFNK